ncbi:hypothetical protein [Nocardia jiangxiensis]|uniref:hypothetical protein n=1 Tax=Nocardia jiangxiensis TaxID=282685 RepID=UPI00031ACD4E|nr:hypothetical protein [Nocardia jiangxiensis]
MNAGQLKRILANYDDDVPIIIDGDPEGNWTDLLGFAQPVWFIERFHDYVMCHDIAPEDAVLALLLSSEA